MCRLFAQISVAPRNASRYLLDAPFSLLKQSDWNLKSRQKDGWGVIYKEDSSKTADWRTFKSCKPIFKEKSLFKKQVADLKPTAILAHIRHASNPDKLPHHKLIGRNHTQPFRYKNLAFIHNGTLNIPNEVTKTLGRYKKYRLGNNDSEVLFLLIVKIWEERTPKGGKADWPRIFIEARAQMKKVWDTIPVSRRKHLSFADGLNVVITDGRTLAAQCSYTPSKARSFCWPKRPYFQMCYNKLNGAVALASEPMDRPGGARAWRDIPNGHALVVEPRGKTFATRAARIHT